ncbi:MAG TPA: hypothetical protein VK980_02405 [Sphingomonas sp.]|nr:hypothetical protein [Sphingomonas sp.]
MPASPYHFYRAFGLTLRSDFVLPELVAAQDDAPVDVTIDHVAALAPLPDLPRLTGQVTVDARTFRFTTPDAADFEARDGNAISVCPTTPSDPAAVRAHLLGSVIGALLLQRGLLPLHASVVAIGDRAIAFTGKSGAGKSTLALDLQQRGHAIIGDDLCAIGLDGARPVTSTGVTRLKLWAPSLHAAGHGTDGLEPIAARQDKYHWPAAGAVEDMTLPLAAIVTLDWADDLTVMPLNGSDAVGALVSNTFRGVLVEPMGIAAAHLMRCATVARAVPVLRLSRPRDLIGLGSTVDAVLDALT